MSNYKNISQYSKIKQCGRPKIYALIEKGLIQTEEVAGIKVIDMDKYGDFDVNARIKDEDADLKKLAKSMTSLKREVRMLKNIILTPNENGRKKMEV